MQKEVGGGYFKQFKYIKHSLLIALSVSDDADCILLAIADLEKLKNDKKSKISLAVLLSFSLCPTV
ncbi:MAG: hypothetical protein ACI4PK_00290 [Oscillospiraceae bacterium]